MVLVLCIKCEHNLVLKVLERFIKSELEMSLILPSFAVVINAVLNN